MLKVNHQFNCSYETEIEEQSAMDIFYFLLCEVYAIDYNENEPQHLTGRNLLIMQQNQYTIDDFFFWITQNNFKKVTYEIADFIIVKGSTKNYEQLTNGQIEILMGRINTSIIKYNIDYNCPEFHRLLVFLLKHNCKDIQSNMFISNMTMHEIK